MNIFARLIDLIYPHRCAECRSFIVHDTDGDGVACRNICFSCLANFHTLDSSHCTICGRPFASRAGDSHVCETCLRRRPAFDTLGAPYLYEGSLTTVIHRFKYGGKRELVLSLGPLLSSFARAWAPAEKASLVMPVPLHPRRLRERGFNQSKLLAAYVARDLGTPLDFLSLRRVRYTIPQTGLRKTERRKNVRRAFGLERPERVSGKRVLLVDDVATTGNTLNECARVLLKAKAEKVSALVLARTANPAM
jgi:ComF family protein